MSTITTPTMTWLEIAIALRDRSRSETHTALRNIYRVQMRGAALQHRWEAGK